MSVLGLCAAPGSKAVGTVDLIGDLAGTLPRAPAAVVNGASPGPKLWLLAGLHGDEIEAMVAVQRVVRDMDPARLSGSVIALVITNPAAFLAWERESSIDGKDLDDVFPGSLTGSYSDRLAYTVYHAMAEIAAEEDCVLTLEGGGRTVLSARLIELRGTGDAIEEKSRKVALAACNPNLRIIVMLDISEGAGAWAGIHKASVTSVIAKDVPVARLTIEAGGMGRMEEADMLAHYDAIFNILNYMGMYDRPIKPLHGEIIFSEQNARVFPTKRGFWIRHVDVGETVRKDQRLASVLGDLGDEIETLYAPYDGIVLYMRGLGVVNSLGGRLSQYYGINVGRYP